MAERGRRRGLLAVLALAILGLSLFLLPRGSDPPARRSRAPIAPAAPPAAPPAPSFGTAAGGGAGATEAAPGAAAPEPAGPGAGTLAVTVVASPEASPIEGAVVAVHDGGEGAALLASRTTGPDGVARFEGIVKDEVRIVARAPGRVPGKAWASGLLGPGGHEAELDLPPGDALEGVVLAAKDRRPVPGALVVVEMGGDLGFLSSTHSDPEHSETVADSEGWFRADGIPRKEIVTFSASAPGYARGRHSLMLGEGSESHPALELLLEEGCPVEGRVLDPDGNPVAGAQVWIWTAERDPTAESLAAFERRIGAWGGNDAAGEKRSGADGRFTFHGLPIGDSYRFAARGKGFGRSRATDPPLAAEGPGPPLRVELRLRRPSSLLVRAVDPAGAPVLHASARLEEEMVPSTEEGGAAGLFDGLVAGEYALEVTAPGFEPARQAVPLGDAEAKEVRVELAPSKPVPSDPSGVIKGGDAPKPAQVRLKIVVTGGGDPPSKAVVATEDLDAGGGSSGEQPIEGGAVLVQLVPGVSTRIAVLAAGYAPAVRDVKLGPGEERDLGEVVLDQGAELSGAVKDPAGKPVAGARLMVDLPAYQSAVGTTGSDGRFRISRLPLLDLHVRIGAAGMLDGEDSVEIAAGGATRNYTLVPAVRVKGSIRGGDGKPAERVHVVFRLQGDAPTGASREFTEYPGADGTFTIAVAAGSYVVVVRTNVEGDAAAGALLRREVAVDAGSPPRVDLVLP